MITLWSLDLNEWKVYQLDGFIWSIHFSVLEEDINTQHIIQGIITEITKELYSLRII